MGIKQLYNNNLRKLPNEYGDVSVMMLFKMRTIVRSKIQIIINGMKQNPVLIANMAEKTNYKTSAQPHV